ncbi:ABC transporter substrate-binding protein [Spirillospora sp. NPDC047279]|uniref:ABC transporter substrate-binding protein n=1 Tax=Spirillospora sp. NPDC047279 TaxID=3155478 RepID=UPI0033D7F911
MNRTLAAAAACLPLLAGPLAAGCTVAGNASSGGDSVRVVVGYQSKTINTVTAGTLLRSLGYFEKRLNALGRSEGTTYSVVWQDYDTGAPITAQMLAGKIDIGSMGDYPLLINGSRAQAQGGDAETRLVSVTGYNLKGALNGVVVAKDSKARTLRDLKGTTVSTSVGSAGHGTFVQAAKKYGFDGAEDVKVENQQPSVGATALESGKAAGLSQFVAWPGVLVAQDRARLLYDGGDLNVPTFHGVVVRKKFAGDKPAILQEFLKAQIDATRYLNDNPVRSSESVAATTGLPVEAVYLYNGAGGVSTFDVTLKKRLQDVLAHDVPFLKSIGVLQTPLDLSPFIDDSHIRRAYGSSYDADVAKTPVSGAGEIWFAGEQATRRFGDPVALLRGVREAQEQGRNIKAAYVADATTGTRWFADKDVWVEDPKAGGAKRFQAFATDEVARAYLAAHPGSTIVTYQDAVERA